MPKIIFLIFIQFICASTWAQSKKAIIFGGNCNAEKSPVQNLMTEDMVDNAKALKKLKWEPMVLHDTNSSVRFKKATASQENLLKTLNDSVDSLKDGDQLVLTIQTHGREEKPNKAHEICMNDTQGFAIDNKDFIAALTKAKIKGIKLGILTDACFGGAMVEKLGSFGCVMSTQSRFATATGQPSKKHFPSDSEEDIEKYKNLRDTYQMGVTTELSRLLEKSQPTTLSDVYLSTLINYNSELYNSSPGDLNEGANFPQFSGHNYGEGNELDSTIALAVNFQKNKGSGLMVIEEGGKRKLQKITEVNGETCSYSSLTEDLKKLIPNIDIISNEVLFSEMLKKYARSDVPKIDNLQSYLDLFKINLNVHLDASKEFDSSLKAWNENSSKLMRAVLKGEERQPFRDEDERLRNIHTAAQKKLIPIEKEITIGYNILKALDYYKNKQSDPCSTFSF